MKENPCTRPFVEFHGYQIYRDGTVLGKRGKPLRTEKRARRGGGYDLRIKLCICGDQKKFTLHRLVAQCFLGPVYGYQINHKDRNPTNNHVDNLERLTPSENQKHWRDNERRNNERRNNGLRIRQH